VMSEENVNFRRKKKQGLTLNIKQIHNDYETNNHIRTLIDKQIFAFVAIKTHAIVFPFNESETNNHIRTLIDKQIFAFVAVKTHAVVFPFNESNVLCMHL